MAQQQTRGTMPEGTIVSVKRVRREVDAKERDKVVLTFGTDQEGVNGLDNLITALEKYRGKQVNFDIRLSKKTSGSGAEFDTAFVIVKEMIPKNQQPATYVAKNKTTTQATKAKADKIRDQFE